MSKVVILLTIILFLTRAAFTYQTARGWKTFTEIDTPATSPDPGFLSIYAKKGADTVCIKNSAGVETCFSGSGSIPSGLITLKTSGTCDAGWSEVTALNGVMLRGTLAANGDVGATGGNDTITPTVNSLTAAAPVFTGTPFSGVINHTHPVNITDPGHTHTMPTYTTDGSGTRPDNGTSTNGTTVTVPSNTTGITATSSNPSGGVASITPAGTNAPSAVTGTLNSFDNRPAYVKVIFCSKD